MVTFELIFILVKKIIMTSKTKRIISTVLIAIPTIVLCIGGIMKLIDAEPEPVMQFLRKAGFGEYIKLLGLVSIIIAALSAYPKTNKIGFLLASCYFSGALCLEISGAQVPVSAAFLSILWVGMFLKDKNMFLSASVN